MPESPDTGRIQSQILLIEVYISEVIYFFKSSYCVPLLYIATYLLKHKRVFERCIY